MEEKQEHKSDFQPERHDAHGAGKHIHHLKEEIKKLKDELNEKNQEIAKKDDEIAKKDNENKELTQKSNQVLATASYYKNEAEMQKKDFERFKERNKNIEQELKQKANEEVAKKLLPIIDNFEQAKAHLDENILKGFDMIFASLENLLSSLGVVEIECDGAFNPEEHNCISTVPCEKDEFDGMVANIYQKGYKFKDTNKVVRASTVSVYKKA